jgi:hypothetical protein
MCALGGVAAMASITPTYSVATLVWIKSPVLSRRSFATDSAPALTRCISPEGTKDQMRGFSSVPSSFSPAANSVVAAASRTRTVTTNRLAIGHLPEFGQGRPCRR